MFFKSWEKHTVPLVGFFLKKSMGEKETEAVLGLRKGVRERGPTKDFPTFTGQTVRPFFI